MKRPIPFDMKKKVQNEILQSNLDMFVAPNDPRPRQLEDLAKSFKKKNIPESKK